MPWVECPSWQGRLYTFISSYPHIPSFLHSIIHLVIPPSASIPNSHQLHHHTYPKSTLIGPSPPCISHSTSHSTSIHVLPQVPHPPPSPSLIRPGPPVGTTTPANAELANRSARCSLFALTSQVTGQRTKRSPDFTEEPPASHSPPAIQSRGLPGITRIKQLFALFINNTHLRLSAFCVCLVFVSLQYSTASLRRW